MPWPAFVTAVGLAFDAGSGNRTRQRAGKGEKSLGKDWNWHAKPVAAAPFASPTRCEIRHQKNLMQKDAARGEKSHSVKMENNIEKAMADYFWPLTRLTI